MKKIELIKKAWKVDPSIFSNSWDFQNEPIEYGDTEDEVCKKFLLKYKGALNSEILDIEVFRKKSQDWIMCGDLQGLRSDVEIEIKLRERMDKIKNSSSEYYYIQNGYLENSILWWGKNGRGHTINLDEAGIFTKEYILKHFEKSNWRKRDIFWSCESVQKGIIRVVDQQLLDFEDTI